MLDRMLRWIALDFDGHSWHVVALWLFSAQTMLFVISLGVDAVWFPGTAYGFLVAMALFAGHVYLDARTVALPRAWMWAAIVTLFPPIGAIVYARRRQYLHRMSPA